MEITTLKYFVTVARELHFRRAAKLLHISQAPLSQQIIKLEDELGIKLFERTSRVVKLTEAGKLFVKEAETILRNVDHAAKKMNAYASGQSGSLVIGYNEPSLNTFLPDALFRFRQKFPAVELQLWEMETEAQLEALRSGEIDLGFLRPFEHDLTGLACNFVFAEQYVLAMKSDHPLARMAEIPPKQLNGLELLLFARDVNPALFDRIVEILAQHEIYPVIRQFARNKTSILALVRSGFGAALVPESCTRYCDPVIVVRTLPKMLPPVELFAARLASSHHPAAENIIRDLTAEI